MAVARSSVDGALAKGGNKDWVAVLRYARYFRLYGRRHICTQWPSVRNGRREKAYTQSNSTDGSTISHGDDCLNGPIHRQHRMVGHSLIYLRTAIALFT